MAGVGKKAKGWTGREEGLGGGEHGAARIRKRVSNDRKSRGFSPTELVLRNRLRPRRLYTCRYGKCKIVLGGRRNRKHRSMMPAQHTTPATIFSRVSRDSSRSIPSRRRNRISRKMKRETIRFNSSDITRGWGEEGGARGGFRFAI